MLEAVYRIAPDLMRNGSTIWPADGVPADAELHMTDFRLLRHGGFSTRSPDTANRSG